ncbi:imidazolonepropionase [Brachybacterium sp. EF45031]|uniref:imidazolonepropionase n=1 Tax=Brachybacterium sillae TaxID=2810536 RepID=UPI00217D69D1|nr:imidazolonepropionase [Brachybacterium sillae]MCS6711760.1 imidazolonepropionase [Brachybacterium sillae]
MTTTLLTGISELWTFDPVRDAERGTPNAAAATDEQVLRDAAVVIDGERIAWTGPAADAPDADERVDLGGRAVLPGWVDSHTHLVFAGDRSAEFEARMAGEAYAAGGIRVTMEATRAAGVAQLAELVRGRIAEAVRGGTTCLETKTGYGLTVAAEAEAAQIAAILHAAGELDEVTFLGAHLVPPEYDGTVTVHGRAADADAYVDLVTGDMLQAVQAQGGDALRWIDVFCEEGAFTTEQSRRVLQAGREAGLGLRVHGNQIGESQAGVQLAVELGAASVDHLNFLSDADIDALASTAGHPVRGEGEGRLAVDAGPTVATILPACDLSTRAPLAPARRLADAGAQLAIASNCNPGTSYTSAMSFCVGTAVLQQHLSLAEALRAATRGGALALRRSDVGHLGVGARADLHVLDAPAAIHLAYRPGMPLTHQVWRRGTRVV